MDPSGGFPDVYHGRWAHAAKDCKAGRALMILSIDAKGLHQMEGGLSVLRASRKAGEPNAIVVEARSSGGGDEWESTEEFTLSADGNVIDWRQVQPKRGRVTRLYRCR